MDVNGNVFPGNAVLDGSALAAISSYLLSLVKPFVERLPFARTGAPLHDAVLRVLSLLINALTVFVLAGANGQLQLGNWLTYVLATIGQTIGSQGLYLTLTRSGASVNSGTPKPAGY